MKDNVLLQQINYLEGQRCGVLDSIKANDSIIKTRQDQNKIFKEQVKEYDEIIKHTGKLDKSKKSKPVVDINRGTEAGTASKNPGKTNK